MVALAKLSFDFRPSLKKCLFGIAYPGFHLVGRSVGIFSLFFNIYYLHMDRMVKKKKNLKFGEKKFE